MPTLSDGKFGDCACCGVRPKFNNRCGATVIECGRCGRMVGGSTKADAMQMWKAVVLARPVTTGVQ